MPQLAPQLRIGTSGYEYAHWKGLFYPRGVPHRQWFDHYSHHFDTVEINNTFYHLPEVSTFEAWKRQAPKGFLYALKYSRYGSHMKKLKDPDSHLGLFLERAERLGPVLGPILVQLPPRWKANPERLDAFLSAAPRRCRWAVEFRDASWLRDDVFAVLERHGAALCIHDLLPDHPWIVTAPWLYLRFHGIGYTGSYAPEVLDRNAERLAASMEQGLDVYAYFNNDIGGYAVPNAGELRDRILARLELSARKAA
jgi:uncharacterized protein YecE (DUF72 family)